MSEREKYARTLHLSEGWLCLDFANTANWHASDEPQEELKSYADLIAWAQAKGVVAEEEANALLQQAASSPEAAALLLRQAIDLREAIFRIFTAVIGEQSPQATDLDLLNAALVQASTRFQLVQGQAGFAWDWTDTSVRLDAPLWPAVRSAAELLTSDDLHRIGMCADDRGCGWLFLDTSRNHSRRWCSMESCGNRAKARLHYRRQQAPSDD